MDISAPFPRKARRTGVGLGAPGGPGIKGFLFRQFVYWPFVNPILWLGNWGRGGIVLLWLAALWWPQPMISLTAFLGLCVVISFIARIDVARGRDVGRWYYAPFKSAERLLPLLVGPVIVGIGIYFLDQRATPGGISRAERETMQFLLLISVLSILISTSMPMWGDLARALLGEPKNNAPASHGSAQFLTEIGRLVGAEGLLIGRAGTALPYRYAGRILANPDPRHMVTVAANGAGKGVSAIVPNLLAYEGSVLAIDPKGELAAITARRREARGQQVFILDPWALTGADTASFNPLSILTDDNPDIVEDAALITDALVFDDGGSDPYWNLEARNMLQGLILHIATDYSFEDEDRTLLTLRRLITLDADAFDELLADMRSNPAADGAVERIANALSAMPEKQFGSIRATARVSTDFLESPRMARVLKHSDLDLTQLKRQPTTVYLCLPASRLGTHNRWLRLMIGLALEAMERERARPERPVLFLMDEFATLGYMRSIENAVGQIRGFGVQLWVILQDLNQLKALYRDRWETFLGNAGTVQFFGINDQFTAQYVSRVLGEQTIMVTSKTYQTQNRWSVNEAERGRALMTPDEVRRLPADQQIILMQGESGLVADKLAYFGDPEFEGLFDENPLLATASRSS
ncbi:MAG: conjugal transfer protein TraG [Rhodobacteraceae bacterium]|nr:conjugal transfer protein TraG [Paracoccaceae bacterium]